MSKQKETSGRFEWGEEGKDQKFTIIRDDGSTFKGTADDFLKEVNRVTK